MPSYKLLTRILSDCCQAASLVVLRRSQEPEARSQKARVAGVRGRLNPRGMDDADGTGLTYKYDNVRRVV